MKAMEQIQAGVYVTPQAGSSVTAKPAESDSALHRAAAKLAREQTAREERQRAKFKRVFVPI